MRTFTCMPMWMSLSVYLHLYPFSHSEQHVQTVTRLQDRQSLCEISGAIQKKMMLWCLTLPMFNFTDLFLARPTVTHLGHVNFCLSTLDGGPETADLTLGILRRILKHNSQIGNQCCMRDVGSQIYSQMCLCEGFLKSKSHDWISNWDAGLDIWNGSSKVNGKCKMLQSLTEIKRSSYADIHHVDRSSLTCQVQERVKIRQPESACALILWYSMYAVQNPCKNCEILPQNSKLKKNAESPTTSKIWLTKWPKTQNFWFWHRPHETGVKQQSILSFLRHCNAVNISFRLRLRIGWYLRCLYIALRLGMF